MEKKKSNAVVAAAKAADEKKVRVGVIGLGMGRAHLSGYKSCPD